MDGERIAIVEGFRTPFTRASGVLALVPPYELARFVIRALLDRVALDETRVDELILGGLFEDQTIGRKSALLAGLPPSVSCTMVSRVEGSGLEALRLAHDRLALKTTNVIVAGAVSSARKDPKEMDEEIFFGILPERLVQEYAIAREEQDAFSLRSHRAAVEFRPKLLEECVPYPIPPAYETLLRQDRGPREGLSQEFFAEYDPITNPHGTQTEMNTSFEAKGAVFLLLMREETAERHGYSPLGYIRAFASVGLPPEVRWLGPAHTIPRLLRQMECTLDDVDLFELEESSAAVVLANRKALSDRAFCRKRLGWVEAVGEIPQDRLNVGGGAIATGRLQGASGARSVLTLLKELKRRGGKKGIVALETSDGQGLALALERDV